MEDTVRNMVVSLANPPVTVIIIVSIIGPEGVAAEKSSVERMIDQIVINSRNHKNYGLHRGTYKKLKLSKERVYLIFCSVYFHKISDSFQTFKHAH